MELYWVKTNRYPWWPSYVRMLENVIMKSVQQLNQINHATNILKKLMNKANNVK